jgi:EmrB/QacA subfamily drug resistance transporter
MLRALSERGILATVALATMLAPLNSTMIAVALPRLMAELDTDVPTAGWLITAYLLVMASIQPVGGKLGDRFGRRPLILGGLLYFAAASLGAAFAPDLPTLFFFRIQQAIAGAIALPNGAALIREVVPAARRASRAGLVGAAVSFAAAAGPPIGGLLAEIGGWRALFFANAPLVAAALIVGWRALPPRSAVPRPPRFDLVGAAGLSCLLIALAALLSRGHESAALLVVGGLAIVGASVLLVRYELRHPDPVLRPRLFTRRAFTAASAGVCMSNLAGYSTLLAIPLLLDGRPGISSAAIGLVLGAMSATTVVCAPAGGRLADRLGRRAAAVGGLGFMLVGLVPFAVDAAGMPLPLLVTALAVIGAGGGLSSAALQISALEAVDAAEAGVAAGVYSTARYLGSIIGSALLGALLGGGADGFPALFAVVLAAGALSVVAGLGLSASRPARPAA